MMTIDEELEIMTKTLDASVDERQTSKGREREPGGSCGRRDSIADCNEQKKCFKTVLSRPRLSVLAFDRRLTLAKSTH